MHSLAKKRTLSVPSSTPCSVKAVKSWLIPSYWDFVRRYVEEALEHANGELTAEDVHQCLLNETMFLFIAQNPRICGAATCEVVQYARKKAIRVVTVAGDRFDDWRAPLQAQLIDWAERIKADSIEAYVRKGLVSQLENLGYRQAYVGVIYDLRQENGKEIRNANG